MPQFLPKRAGVVAVAAALCVGLCGAVVAHANTRGWRYVNPLREVSNLQPSRIDMGVDYSGAGSILALGRAKVVLAGDKFAGPESCWGKTCVPAPGDMIVYRLLDGPFAGHYIYVVEHLTVGVRAGQTVRAGERIATLHRGSPNLEMGWALGRGVWTLAAARGHEAHGDPGGWSSIEGRNFNALMVWLAAPSGYLTTIPANQHMPAGWPTFPARAPRIESLNPRGGSERPGRTRDRAPASPSSRAGPDARGRSTRAALPTSRPRRPCRTR